MTSSAASGAAATDAAGAAGGTSEDRAGSSMAVNAGVGVQAADQPQASSGEQAASLKESWQIDEGAEALAAVRLQRWWRAERRVGRTAAALLAQAEQLESAAAVLSDHSSKGFEDVLQRIQSKKLIASVAGLLAAVDGPDSFPPMSPRLKRSPRAVEAARQQQARKFLTSIMIKHHPEEVIATSASSDDEEAASSGRGSLESLEARLLRVAAHLALASAVALIQALDGLEARRPGARAIFRIRLHAFALARAFLHEALEVLQAIRTSSVAASFLGSYGEAYRYLKDAERSEQAALVVQARLSLDKVKLGIAKVIGREKTERHCLSVERALESHEPFVVLSPGDIKVPLPAMGSTPRRPAAPAAAAAASASTGGAAQPSPAAGDEAGAAVVSSLAGPASEDGEAEAVAVPPSLAALLRNEFLAHEILLNPDFKLEDRKPGGEHGEGPMAQQFAQVREAMEKMFWERLTLALTPAEQATDEDFVPGAVVQLRFGGAGGPGSFFLARLEAVHHAGEYGREEAVVDVVYLTDGTRERRPLRDLRKASDPLDFAPLLALLDDVREKLGELTPKRADLAAELRAHLDTELLGQMARRGVLEATSVRAALAFAVGRVTQLQAPARAAETAAWFAQMDAQAEAALASAESVDGKKKQVMGPQFVALLPELFRTIFERIDETRRDVANAHVGMLRPFLAQHGVAYERQKFSERLRAGEVKLQHTQAWLQDCLAGAGPGPGPEQRPHLAALARGDAGAHKRAVADALGRLLVKPVRLDNPAAARLPETLLYDGRRLAGLRDELDRLTLVAVFSTLLRQFLSAQRLPAARSAGEILAALETRLYIILQDDEQGEVKLPHLVDEAAAAAKRVFEAAAAEGAAGAEGGGAAAAMSSEQGATLRGVLTSAVSFDNPLFALLFARLAEVLGAYSRGEDGGAGELIGRYGFRPFEPQLAAAGKALRRVLNHSLAVHGDLYSRILRQEAATLLAAPNGSAAP